MYVSDFGDQRLDQPRRLGDADAQHRHDDHAHSGKVHEVPHHVGVHEADARRRQQALHGRRRLLDRVRLRVDGVVRGSGAGQIEDVGQQDHQQNKRSEDDHRVGNFVSNPLNAIENPLHERF
jgi:hypothetical protein